MLTLTELISTGDAIFLRDHARGDILHRLPPAPKVLGLGDGKLAMHFTMYRYASNDPSFDMTRGGAVLLTALDFGTLPSEDAEAQTQLPGNAPPQISLPPVSAGEVHLWMGGEVVASEAIPVRSRPIVPLTLQLTVDGATILHAASKGGKTLLWTTAEGNLLLHYFGPPFQVRADWCRARRYLTERGASFSANDIASVLVPALIEHGIIRIDLTGDGNARECMLIASALTAGQLLEPEPGSGPWSGIPGIAPAPLSLKGRLRVRNELNGDRRQLVINADSTVHVPWFASAPIGPLHDESVNQVDLDDSPVRNVQVRGIRSGVAEKYHDTRIEFEFPSGQSAAMTFMNWDRNESEQLTIRYITSAGQSTYRYRLTAVAETGSIVGQWISSDSVMVIAFFDALAAH
ncbi:hypothetical protein [Rhodococcus koreensis]